MRILRGVTVALFVLIIAAGLFMAIGWRHARADPIVRRATIGMADWPRGARPVKLVLLSDIHIESPTMDAARLMRIVRTINAQKPDIIVIAGDFIEGGSHREPDKVAPVLGPALRTLHAPLGVIAVLGNHDWWTNAPDVRRLIRRTGVTLLENQATTRGPLAIGGLDDPATGHDQLNATAAALRPLLGAHVMIAHSPAVARRLGNMQPFAASLLLAGHTHCGQVVLPLLGAIVRVVEERYRCGVVRDDDGLTIVITAGLGTSEIPIRYGAPPDIWLLTLGPISQPRP